MWRPGRYREGCRASGGTRPSVVASVRSGKRGSYSRKWFACTSRFDPVGNELQIVVERTLRETGVLRNCLQTIPGLGGTPRQSEAERLSQPDVKRLPTGKPVPRPCEMRPGSFQP